LRVAICLVSGTLVEISKPVVSTVRNSPHQAPRSVVIVDDEKSYVELMAQMIADNLDCQVHPFTRPEDALNGLAAISAGVIVTDYFMPQMDGVEFIKRASKIAPRAAFIMISGHNLEPIEHELARLKRLKMRLQKPFGWRPLTAAVLKVWPGKDVPSLRP
jgi:DNA-binding NtrC family response regulator